MSLLDPVERRARGVDVGAMVRGCPLPPPATPYEESWRDFIFAEVWNRPGLDRRSRFFISIATAALCLGGQDDLVAYVRGALSSGEATLPELREAALHMAVYAGWTRGGDIDRAVSRVASELDLADVAALPIRGEPWDAQERLDQGHANFTDVMTFPPGPPARPFYHAINNFVFGEMWKRPGLDQRARRWMTLAAVVESGADNPTRTHIYGAIMSGDCSAAEIDEFVLHYALHGGWPKASAVQPIVVDIVARIGEGRNWKD